MKYKLELIQIFRGIAAVMVILYHFYYENYLYLKWVPFGGVFKYGWLGVDFFFVLSGFIITYIHLKDLRSGQNIASFLRKRFVRVYPIYWVVATLVLLYIIVVRKGYKLAEGPPLTWSVDSLVYTIKCYLLIVQRAPFFLGVAWTLSFEILFYIVFALCIKLKYRLAVVIYFLWMALIMSKQLLFPHISNLTINFLLNPVILEFMVGCLVAYLFLTRKISLTIPLFTLMLILLIAGGYLLLSTYNTSLTRANIYCVLLFGLSAGLLVWTIATLDSIPKWANRIPKPKLLLFLGNASYSIYLIHDIFLRNYARFTYNAFAKLQLRKVPVNLYGYYFVVLTLVVVSASLFYMFVENPLMKFINAKLSKA